MKATTGEGIGFVGRGEGVAALAIASLDAATRWPAMREILLHDTRSGELLRAAARATPAGSASTRAGRPSTAASTSATRGRSWSSACCKRFLEHEGYEVRLVINVTDVNDKIYDAARAQGRPSAELAAEMTELYRADTDALGLGPPRPRAAGLGDDRADRRLHPDADRLAATPMRPAATSTSACARTRATAASRTGGSRTAMDQGEGIEGVRAQGGPARLRAVEGPQGGRGHRLGLALGAGPARAGTSSARRWPRSLLGVGFDIHGGGSDLLFPHHENEAAQTRAARGEELARLWMHNGMIQFTGEKMAKSVGNIAPLHEVHRAVRPRRRGHVPDLRALPPAARLLGGRAGGRRRQRAAASARRSGDSSPGEPSPADMARHRERVLRRAGERLQHADGAGRR